MTTLLHILAHPSPEQAHTVRISGALLDSYRQTHPDDDIVTLDLYREEVPFFSATHMRALGKQAQPESMTPEERKAWDGMMRYIQQLCNADKYLITAPMWNFNIPAILKAYIDLVAQAGHTFRYTEIGTPEGMLLGRPMVIVSARGGIYSQPPMSEMEMSTRYLRSIFGFLGIHTIAEIVAEGLALVGPDQQQEIMQPLLERARTIAREL